MIKKYNYSAIYLNNTTSLNASILFETVNHVLTLTHCVLGG